MPLTAGTEVLVLSLNRRGQVEACLRAGMYRVRIGGMTTTVREEDLRVAPGKTPKGPARAETPEGRDAGVEGGVSPSLDLHGLTVDEARNRLAAYISRAILAGLDRVEIIHGIGTGRLKAAVTADLKQITAVRRVAPHPGNPGVLVVYL
jgi:DNA mismatch repair protein MutS2